MLTAQHFQLPEVGAGTAFLLHGYYDHAGLYGHLIRQCLALGYSVIIMDSLLNRKLDECFGLAHYVLLCPLLYPVGWSLIRDAFYLTRSIRPEIKRSFTRNSHDDGFLRFLREHDRLQARALPTDWIAAMADYQQRFAEAAKSEVPV